MGPVGPEGAPGKDGDTPDIEPYLKKAAKEHQKFEDQIRKSITRASFGSSSGGGEVRLEFLDDVDRDSAKTDGKYLKFDSASGKFVGADAAGGGGGDLSSVSEHIVPSANNVYDLGHDENRWRDLYLSGNTINLAGATISSDGTGVLSISATGALLPEGSRVGKAGTEKALATISDDGVLEATVPLFTQASGLKRPAINFAMRADSTTRVFNGFTLNNGESITKGSKLTLFLF
jgi:hypothetical protein